MLVNEKFELTNEQVKKYLDRLELSHDIKPTKENLKKLQCRHLAKIPYENLSILLGQQLSLNGEDLFHKIIKEKKGGYCFELNGLYSFLLKAFGYKVTSYNSRFVFKDEPPQLRRHRVLKVDFEDESYITDVGVRNESPRQALVFQDGLIQTDGISEYKFTSDDYYGHVMWRKRPGKDWESVFAFDDSPQAEIDFIMPNYYCETHPKSPFTDCPHMSIFPEGGHVTVTDHMLTITQGNDLVEKKEIMTENEFIDVCRKYFGITLSHFKVFESARQRDIRK